MISTFQRLMLFVATGLFIHNGYSNTCPIYFTEHSRETKTDPKLPYTDTVEYGCQRRFRLSNNTVVFLNSGSSIQFQPQKKIIKLSGEGLFEITEDSTIIKVNDQVEVISYAGSRVNVTAYKDFPDEPLVIATLIEGSMRVRFGDNLDYFSVPGQQLTVNKDFQFNTERDQAADAIVWTQGTFNYNGMKPYREIFKRICRWYNLELEYPPTIPPLTVKFASEFNDSLSQIIWRMNYMSLRFQCQIKGKKLIVSKVYPEPQFKPLKCD